MAKKLFEKGRKKTGGRKQGTPNKATVIQKLIDQYSKEYADRDINLEDLKNIVLENIITAGLLSKNKKVNLLTSFKLLPYIIPRKKEDDFSNTVPAPHITEPNYDNTPNISKADNSDIQQ